MKYLFGLMSLALLCAVSIAQTDPSSSPNGAGQNSATQPQNSQTSPSQPQAPPTMQPGTVPPTEPQTSRPQATAPQTPPPGALKIAPGSVIPVQLTKTIDAKKAKQGDEVVAKVTIDMKTDGGQILVPKDTTVVGHVTEAQARNKEQKESQVGISFDKAKMKSGDMPLPMSIQAIIAPLNNADTGGDSGGPAQWACDRRRYSRIADGIAQPSDGRIRDRRHRPVPSRTPVRTRRPAAVRVRRSTPTLKA